MKLQEYARDGANYQARAVLAYLQCHNGIEDSWDSDQKRYTAEIEVARWENCREQGYVLTLRNGEKQLNIAFYEHRNSDSICAIEWEQAFSVNTPTITTADFGDKFKDKWDTDKSVGYGEVTAMAEWIWERLETYWAANNPEP